MTFWKEALRKKSKWKQNNSNYVENKNRSY